MAGGLASNTRHELYGPGCGAATRSISSDGGRRAGRTPDAALVWLTPGVTSRSSTTLPRDQALVPGRPTGGYPRPKPGVVTPWRPARLAGPVRSGRWPVRGSRGWRCGTGPSVGTIPGGRRERFMPGVVRFLIPAELSTLTLQHDPGVRSSAGWRSRIPTTESAGQLARSRQRCMSWSGASGAHGLERSKSMVSGERTVPGLRRFDSRGPPRAVSEGLSVVDAPSLRRRPGS